MKRYILFAGQSFYAEGGWGDFKGDFDTIDEAKAHVANLDVDWCHVVDSTTLQAVVYVAGDYCGELPDILLAKELRK